MTTKLNERGSGFSGARLLGRLVLGALLLICAGHGRAADAKPGLTPEQIFEGGTNAYNNWVELSVGGLITHGDPGQAEQVQHLKQGAFGGIEDLHFQQDIDKKTTLTLDAHALFDDHDYKLSLGVKREDLGYVRVGFENFRTWYDSSGGFFPATAAFYSLSNDALELDRGQIFFEAGLTLKNAPKVIFKYTHTYRDGEKSSTAWGPVQATIPTPPPGLNSVTRNLYPGFYDIDEKADIFQLDVTHRIKATDLGLGVRYENGDLNDALKTYSRPDDPTQSQKITDRQGTSYDMLSVHAFTETWIKKNLSLSTGFLFANLDNTFSGSRIYGDDFDVSFVPSSLSSLNYMDLNGGSHKKEYVVNVNLMMVPVKQFTIVPSIRVGYEDWNADAAGTGILNSDLGTFTGPFNSSSERDLLDVRERVDFRYTGVTNWVFYAGPEWTEGEGNLKENGGLSRIAGFGVPPVLRETDDSHFYQKYFAGARWYPARWGNVDVGGYYKDSKYDYSHEVDSTANDPTSLDRYPAFLVMQGFETYDANVRLTLKPVRNVALVSRYEYQTSTVRTRPDPVSELSEVDSSKMISHIIGQNVNWAPLTRLSLQVGFTYVLSDTKTPTSDYTQAVLDAQNNYWTLNFNAGVVLDDKTDLNLGYFYYQSDNFEDNSIAGLPLGAAAKEHGVTATLSRRLSRNVRLNLKYGYSNFEDIASGGHNNYEAHLVYSSLQYRF